MYTLFGSAGSGSAAIETALEHIGAPYRIVTAATWAPTSALDELRAVNPLQQVPSLTLPDGSVLTESAAILIHLALTYPEAKLLPAEATRRAQCIRGLVFIAANCYANIGIIDYPERWLPEDDKPSLELLKKGARARLHLSWEIFADSFKAQPYYTGEDLGALDILAAVVSKWSGTRAHVKVHRPDFFATLQRIEEHPSVAPVFARHWKPA
jgi:GST-like protein